MLPKLKVLVCILIKNTDKDLSYFRPFLKDRLAFWRLPDHELFHPDPDCVVERAAFTNKVATFLAISVAASGSKPKRRVIEVKSLSNLIDWLLATLVLFLIFILILPHCSLRHP